MRRRGLAQVARGWDRRRAVRTFTAEPVGDPDSWVTLERAGDGIGTLSMHKPPVNSMCYGMMRQIIEAHQQAVADPGIRGLIIRSDLPKVFSAGLDLECLHNANRDELAKFWKGGMQDLFKEIYGSPLVMAAAIGGHAPAGGCFLGLLCDIRIMARGGRIGLNETQLGISPPFYFFDAYRGAIGLRQAEKAMQLGTLFSADEALDIGLVDTVVNTKEEAEALAAEEMRQWLAVPDVGRRLTKNTIRKLVLDEFCAARPDDLQRFCDHVESEKVQASISEYLAALKGAKK